MIIHQFDRFFLFCPSDPALPQSFSTSSLLATVTLHPCDHWMGTFHNRPYRDILYDWSPSRFHLGIFLGECHRKARLKKLTMYLDRVWSRVSCFPFALMRSPVWLFLMKVVIAWQTLASHPLILLNALLYRKKLAMNFWVGNKWRYFWCDRQRGCWNHH